MGNRVEKYNIIIRVLVSIREWSVVIYDAYVYDMVRYFNYKKV